MHYVIASTGVGKSFIALALAQKACRDGHSALYLRAATLLRDLALARADGSLRHLLARLSRIDVLVIDDWAMAPLNETERREIWEICEDRYQTRSTILTSQLPVSRWHEPVSYTHLDVYKRQVRGLDKSAMRALAKDSAWVRNHENVFVLGPTDPATFCCTSLTH